MAVGDGDECVPHVAAGSAGPRAWPSALEATFGAPPVQLRTLGGTVPIAPFIEALGFPAVLVPIVNFDNNQHEENENLRLGALLSSGIEIVAVLGCRPEREPRMRHRSEQRRRRIVRRLEDGGRRGGDAEHHVGERRVRLSRRRSRRDAPDGPARARVGRGGGRASGIPGSGRLRPARDADVGAQEVEDMVLYQIGALSAIAAAEGVRAVARQGAWRALQHGGARPRRWPTRSRGPCGLRSQR